MQGFPLSLSMSHGITLFSVFLPFSPFSSALIYGVWRVAGRWSYDVWPQRLFLSVLIWQSSAPSQAVIELPILLLLHPFLLSHASGMILWMAMSFCWIDCQSIILVWTEISRANALHFQYIWCRNIAFTFEHEVDICGFE